MVRVYHEDMEFRVHHKDVELASMSMEGSLEV
jgi:hypothetical protein